MAANHNTDNNYRLGLSTAGIIYNGKGGVPRFSSRFGWTNDPHRPQVADHPIKIYSSSDGLIACHDQTSDIYYIGNPDTPDSYIPLPETPRPHNPHNSNAVLVSEFSARRVYHLVCAILEGTTVYNFDVYSSFHGRWLSRGRNDVGGYIVPDTGVSCGSFAYWLTGAPRCVIRFNVNDPQNMIRKIRILDRGILVFPPGTTMQLGRVGDKLGLVTLDASFRVILYLLEQGGRGDLFHPYATFNLPIPNPTVTALIRFQSFKAELFFWVNRKLFLWEENAGFLEMENTGEEQVRYGIAHVITPRLPEDFPHHDDST